MRALLFLFAESLLFTGLLTLSWFVLKRALRLLGAPVAPLGRVVLPSVWVFLFATNLVFTKHLGPAFTTLYRVSSFAVVGSLVMLAVAAVLRRTRRVGAIEP